VGIQEEQGIELMLRMNGMTRADVQIVEFPTRTTGTTSPR